MVATTVEQTKTPVRDEVENLKAEMAQLKKQMAQRSGSTKQITDFDVPDISRKVIEDFISSTRPDTEFYAMPNPGGDAGYKKLYLFNDEEYMDPVTKVKRRREAVLLEFAGWVGPGANLLDPKTNKPERFGKADLMSLLSNRRQIRIIDEDREKFELPLHDGKLLRDNVTGIFTVEQCLAKVFDSKSYKQRKVVTGEFFRLMIKTRYEASWSRMQAEARLNKAQAELEHADQIKVGALTGVS